MTNPKGKRLYLGLLVCLFGLMLLLNALTPWVADDFMYSFSFETKERLSSIKDVIPSVLAHGRMMNGRYTPHFLVQSFTLLPWWVFDVCNSLVFVLMMAGMVRLICGRRSYDWIMLCGLTAAMFVLTPGFGSSFLWMSGSCNYLWCDALLVWLLAPFEDAVLERDGEPSLPARICMIPAALFFGNMSENVSAGGVMLMGFAMLWLIFKHKRVRVWMILTTLAAFAGWLLCIASPGEIARIDYNVGGLGILLDNFQRAAAFLVEHGTLPAAALLALAAWSWFDGGDRSRVAIAGGFLLAALACTYCLTASMYFPSRAFTGSTIMLICGCAFALPKAQHERLKTLLSLCLCFMMVTTLLAEMPKLYDSLAKYNDRENLIAETVAEGKTELTTFGILSKTHFDCFFEVQDVTIYPDSNANHYFAKYHGLDSIVAERFE